MINEDKLRETTRIERTRDNAGLKLTVEVVAYDDGSEVQVVVDKRVMSGEPWLGAAATLAQKLQLLHRDHRARQRQRSA